MRAVRFRGVLSALLGLWLVVAVGSAARAGPTGTLSGTVSAAGSGAPLGGALMEARQGSTPVGQTNADGSGAYSLTLAPGTYDVVASAVGYLPETRTGVVVVKRATTTENFSLAAAPPPTGGIAGVVRDASTTNPLTGALVEARQGSTVVASDTSDAQGGYTLAGLAPGLYDVTASQAGYGAQSTPAVTVSAGNTTALDFALPSVPPDSDGDGVADPDDQCPATPAGQPVDAAGCSAWQRDTDADGVFDAVETKLGTDPADPADVPAVRTDYHYDARGAVQEAIPTAGTGAP